MPTFNSAGGNASARINAHYISSSMKLETTDGYNLVISDIWVIEYLKILLHYFKLSISVVLKLFIHIFTEFLKQFKDII